MTAGPVPGRWRKLALLGGGMVVDNTEAGMVTGLFPVIRQSLGLSLDALGILTAASKIVGVFTAPAWVWAANRWSRKGVLAFATGLWGIWGIAAGFSQDFVQLLIFYTILAAGNAAAAPIITEIIGDLFADNTRGKAVGLLYGGIALFTSVIGPLKGQLAGVDDGWRWGMWGIGAFNMLLGAAIWIWFDDPGVGASERQLADIDRATRAKHSQLTWAKTVALLRIPTFLILLGSRLLSGHLLVLAFGVVFLVDVYGFSTEVASIVLLPAGIGVFVGNLLSGPLSAWAQRHSPRNGLVAVLQAAQFAFAGAALVGTQFDWGSIWLFGAFFGLMALVQGLNPGINRPMVMAVTPPGDARRGLRPLRLDLRGDRVGGLQPGRRIPERGAWPQDRVPPRAGRPDGGQRPVPDPPLSDVRQGRRADAERARRQAGAGPARRMIR
ncbi:MFS transporter [Bailinhaonella thermotolerans]|uniref:MFS transporter n=1 Tax=Bailinhaonella thermotolerans TaxID=1070861 RepID=A0A3A4AB33_9ACTN|nr:MFS transporter [Bailinhaonella thermotolerans]RJL23260.1 MFS transporter [Bailinhaonella thermotolerans]